MSIGGNLTLTFCVILSQFLCSEIFADMIPASVISSPITFRTTYVGTMPSSGNPTSPINVNSDQIYIDQRGYLYHRNSSGTFSTVFDKANAPAGLSLFNNVEILNATYLPNQSKVAVVFTSTTLPMGVSVSESERGNDNAYQVVYTFDYNGDSALTNPEAIVAFEVFTGGGHSGGGLATLPDGDLLFAIGDNGNFNQDGAVYPQEDESHIGKIVRIDLDEKDWTVVAKGVRNPQRIVVTEIDGEEHLTFVDLGGNISEELNSILLSTLLDESTIENFGWGRNVDDNLAREGTFYIDNVGDFSGEAPLNESGFYQPIAQWGREDASYVAGTGPIVQSPSFDDVDFLFGDLVSGKMYAVRGDGETLLQDVFSVQLITEDSNPTTLATLAGGRPDPRFFTFPDGTAGVVLERTGAIYQLTQVSSVPEPSSLFLGILLTGLFVASHYLRVKKSLDYQSGTHVQLG